MTGRLLPGPGRCSVLTTCELMMRESKDKVFMGKQSQLSRHNSSLRMKAEAQQRRGASAASMSQQVCGTLDFGVLRETRETNPGSIRCQCLRSCTPGHHNISVPHSPRNVSAADRPLFFAQRSTTPAESPLLGFCGPPPSKVLRYHAPRLFIAATHILLSGNASNLTWPNDRRTSTRERPMPRPMEGS